MSAENERHTISLVWNLSHSLEKVWRALTQPEYLARWLMATDMQAVVGQRFTFKQEPTPWWDGIVQCEILEFEPERRIRYSWQSGSGPSELDTIVTWTLLPTPSGSTRLLLEQSGFQPKNAFAFDGALKGWEHLVRERLVPSLAEPVSS